MPKTPEQNRASTQLLAAAEAAESIPGWGDRDHLVRLAGLAQTALRSGGLAVEVGSWKGRSAYVLAAQCAKIGARLLCIDTWMPLPADHPHAADYARMEYRELSEDPEAVFAAFREHLATFAGLVEAWRGDSRRLHTQLPDGGVDLVYLDGDHSEPVIGQDLDHFWPKVRPGGVFCGDDWGQEGVTPAVIARFPGVSVMGGLWWVRRDG